MEDKSERQTPSQGSDSFSKQDDKGRVQIEVLGITPGQSQVNLVEKEPNTHSQQPISGNETHDNGPQPRHETGDMQNPGSNKEPETHLTEQEEYDHNVADIQVDLDNQKEQNSDDDMPEQYSRQEDNQHYKVQTVEEESSMSSIEEVEDCPDEKSWVPMSNVQNNLPRPSAIDHNWKKGIRHQSPSAIRVRVDNT